MLAARKVDSKERGNFRRIERRVGVICGKEEKRGKIEQVAGVGRKEEEDKKECGRKRTKIDQDEEKEEQRREPRARWINEEAFPHHNNNNNPPLRSERSWRRSIETKRTTPPDSYNKRAPQLLPSLSPSPEGQFLKDREASSRGES